MLPHFVIPLYSFTRLLIHLFLKSVSLRVASREQAHFGPPDSELACFLVCVCVGAHLGNESAHIGEKKKHVRHGLCCKTEHLYVVVQWKAHCHPFMCNSTAHLRTAFSRVCMFRMITKYARSLAVAMSHKRLRDGLD